MNTHPDHTVWLVMEWWAWAGHPNILSAHPTRGDAVRAMGQAYISTRDPSGELTLHVQELRVTPTKSSIRGGA